MMFHTLSVTALCLSPSPPLVLWLDTRQRWETVSSIVTLGRFNDPTVHWPTHRLKQHAAFNLLQIMNGYNHYSKTIMHLNTSIKTNTCEVLICGGKTENYNNIYNYCIVISINSNVTNIKYTTLRPLQICCKSASLHVRQPLH